MFLRFLFYSESFISWIPPYQLVKSCTNVSLYWLDYVMWHMHVPVDWSLFREMSVNSCGWHHCLLANRILLLQPLSDWRPTSEDIDLTPLKALLLYEKSSLINSAFSFFSIWAAGSAAVAAALFLSAGTPLDGS